MFIISRPVLGLHIQFHPGRVGFTPRGWHNFLSAHRVLESFTPFKFLRSWFQCQVKFKKSNKNLYYLHGLKYNRIYYPYETITE